MIACHPDHQTNRWVCMQLKTELYCKLFFFCLFVYMCSLTMVLRQSSRMFQNRSSTTIAETINVLVSPLGHQCKISFSDCILHYLRNVLYLSLLISLQLGSLEVHA